MLQLLKCPGYTIVVTKLLFPLSVFVRGKFSWPDVADDPRIADGTDVVDDVGLQCDARYDATKP